MVTNEAESGTGRAAYGGRKLTVECPSCGNEVQLLDRKFVRFGPVRCGACGADLRGLARVSDLADRLLGREG